MGRTPELERPPYPRACADPPETANLQEGYFCGAAIHYQKQAVLLPNCTPDYLRPLARATGPHQEFNKYLGAPKTQPDVERRRGSGSIEIKQILSATSRETLFSGAACPGLVIAPVYYCRRLLSPTSHTHIGLLSPPFSASATSWRLLGHQQARLQIRVLCRP